MFIPRVEISGSNSENTEHLSLRSGKQARRWLSISVAGTALIGFALGVIIPAAVAQNKVRVPNTAAIAIYYDRNGNQLLVEDLYNVRRQVREIDQATNTPCSPGYCQVIVNGVAYCIKC